MDYKLFLSTFALIFLAELGDKTQLAAMARTASSESGKWVVFAGASAALVVSTLIAVVFGAALTRVVPQNYIRGAAGILFVLFGVLILHSVFFPRVAASEAAAPTGVLARAVIRAAARFESASAEDYRALAERARDPRAQALFVTLAREEDEHFSRMHAFTLPQEDLLIPELAPKAIESRPELEHDVAKAEDPVLQHAIEHEEALAAFYRSLSADTGIASLKAAFARLAEEETSHARRLHELAAAMTAEKPGVT